LLPCFFEDSLPDVNPLHWLTAHGLCSLPKTAAPCAACAGNETPPDSDRSRPGMRYFPAAAISAAFLFCALQNVRLKRVWRASRVTQGFDGRDTG